MENERTCDVCDATCFNGSGICATENAVDDNSNEHMERYINNRNARTGQTWHVVERYYTDGNCRRVADNTDWGYERAVVENEYGERVRIWYYGPYWRVA